MKKSLNKILHGYEAFRQKYAHGDQSIMKSLAIHGQKPEIMVVSCCDSRVDPALILQCDPGDLFVVRNVANIVPPYEKDEKHHGTSAALEFATCFLKVKHLILLGHSQCGGLQALLNNATLEQNDFITNWVSVVQTNDVDKYDVDDFAKLALKQSYKNCMTFPWLASRVKNEEMVVHLWFFDIQTGQIFCYNEEQKKYINLSII